MPVLISKIEALFNNDLSKHKDGDKLNGGFKQDHFGLSILKEFLQDYKHFIGELWEKVSAEKKQLI